MIYIFLLISISTILSYLIFKFIYRIIFKSQKKISKFLVFLGSIGLIIFYYTPYSYYLEPSYHQFKKICELDPEIYQAKGGKLDEEYYNKVLAYFDTNIDGFIRHLNKNTRNWDMLSKWQNDRLKISFTIVFKGSNKFGNITKINTLDNIAFVELFAIWRDLRPILDGNEGSGFYLSGDRENCGYFKRKHKGVKNGK